VLPILKYDHASNIELAADAAQPNSIPANVESVDELRIGLARSVISENSYRQYRLRPVYPPLIAYRRLCVCRQSFQSFI